MTITKLEEIKKNYKVLEIAVDFINPSYNISRAKHLDTARYILCTLTENGIPRTVKANETARIRLQKPDRTYVYNDCDVLEDGRVFITLTEQILAVKGNAVCDIQLTDEETGIIYSTKNFIINIDKTAVNNSIMESTNEFGALNNLIATNKKLNDELNANEEVRQDNENERINNETVRQENEVKRQTSETERENAENIRITNEEQRIATNEFIKQTFAVHINQTIYSEEGVHGLRYHNQKLQVYNEDGNWIDTTNITDIAHTYKKMTVNIDLSNSNPETCITYADDAVGMNAGSDEWDEFFGHYPVLFKNGEEVGKLNPNDFTQFEDGTAADITSGDAGDVMIAFPRRGLTITSIGDVLTISMTDNPDSYEFEYNAHTRGKTRKEIFYLGAYGGCYKSYNAEDEDKMRSLSGKNLVGNIDTISEFRTMAQANGAGYEINGFYQLVFRQCMYLLKYKNLNSQEAVGYGITDYAGRKPSGGTETWGMDCENIRQTNPSYMTDQLHHVKLFGLEDFWGNAEELIDGLFINNNFEILTGTDNFNDTGDGYINNGSIAMTEEIDTLFDSPFISKVTGTTKTGFIIKEGNGSTTTYFCDASNFKGSCVCSCGGFSTFSMSSGAFACTFMAVDGTRSILTGSRLMYL